MMRTMTAVAAVMTAPADHAHSAAVAAACIAVTAAVHAATVAATMAAGAGFSDAEHCKAEHRTRGDGQKGRFANHDTLL